MTSLTTATIEEIRDAASRLCRDYLTGPWKSTTAEDIVVKRISGGLSNFLYYISLPEVCDNNSNKSLCNIQTAISNKRQRKDSTAVVDEPHEVLLRIYGQTHGEHALETMITESVVFALLSERNLGPKLYGLFPGGRIEEYIPARPLVTVELSDYKTSMKIAEKMGEIHSLNIPVSKEPVWLWNTMRRWLNSLDSILKNISPTDEEKSEVKEIKKINFENEVKWLRKIIDKGDYPVVFCHNDLQEGNILLKEETFSSRRESVKSTSSSFAETDNDASTSVTVDRNSNTPRGLVESRSRKRSIPTNDNYTDLDNTRDSVLSSDSEDCEPDLIIIDFEYCAYNYRGFDLANHFIEWTLDYSNPQFPFYFHYTQQYPTQQQRQDFISAYLKKQNESIENYSPTMEDIEAVEKEIRVFSLVSHLFWALWSVVNVHQNIEFGYWEYGVSRIREYLVQKDILNVH